MKKAIVITWASALLLCSWGSSCLSADQADLMSRAHTFITYGFKDPNAAQFRNDRLVGNRKTTGEPFQVVCGEVNAKNSYGAYVGFRPYFFLDESRSAIVESGVDGVLYEAWCVGQ